MWRSMAQRIRRAGRETSAKIGLLRRAPGVITSIMHRYGQYCPVARAAEILADRWTVLIIRELLADVSHFNELERGLPRMSRTLLAERLRRLQQAGVLQRRGASRGKRTVYHLTSAGRELQSLLSTRRMGSALGFWRSASKRTRSCCSVVVDAAPCVHRGLGEKPRGDPVRLRR